MLLSVPELKTYIQAETYRKVFELPNEIDIPYVEYIRNHLLLHISIMNVKRTGILEEFNLTHLEDCMEEENGKYTILIGEGKTLTSCGAAGILLEEEEMKALTTYITYLRPFLSADPKMTQIFCKAQGTRASTWDICHFTQMAFWSKQGVVCKHINF